MAMYFIIIHQSKKPLTLLGMLRSILVMRANILMRSLVRISGGTMTTQPRPIMLIQVNPNQNANKIYNMYPEGDRFRVEFGRVGASKQVRTYPISQWNKKYSEKIAKGYKDVTELSQELIAEEAVDEPYRPIEDNDIRKIVDRLRAMASEAVKKNYTVAASAVTHAMIEEAEFILASLKPDMEVAAFNEQLISLFHAIPRRMGDVRTHIATSPEDFAAIIERESDLLDVMKGQVYTAPPLVKADKLDLPDQTILEANGLTFESATEEDVALIKERLGSCSSQFVRAWRVCNHKTAGAFHIWQQVNGYPQTKLLWHGSRNENWWSIINMGLVLKPNAVITGKMFGHGIYFAPSARKSLGYTSLSGSYWAHGSANTSFMALMEVSYGTPYDVHTYGGGLGSMNYEQLQNACPGAHCLHAHAGSMLRNDEIIVYKEEQVTIRYLVEVAKA